MFHLLRKGLMSPMLYSHWLCRSILSLGHPVSTSQMLRLQVGPPRPVRTAVVIEPRTCSMLVSHSASCGMSVDFIFPLSRLSLYHIETCKYPALFSLEQIKEFRTQTVGFFSWYTDYVRFLCQSIITLLPTPQRVCSLCAY